MDNNFVMSFQRRRQEGLPSLSTFWPPPEPSHSPTQSPPPSYEDCCFQAMLERIRRLEISQVSHRRYNSDVNKICVKLRNQEGEIKDLKAQVEVLKGEAEKNRQDLESLRQQVGYDIHILDRDLRVSEAEVDRLQHECRDNNRK